MKTNEKVSLILDAIKIEKANGKPDKRTIRMYALLHSLGLIDERGMTK